MARSANPPQAPPSSGPHRPLPPFGPALAGPPARCVPRRWPARPHRCAVTYRHGSQLGTALRDTAHFALFPTVVVVAVVAVVLPIAAIVVVPHLRSLPAVNNRAGLTHAAIAMEGMDMPMMGGDGMSGMSLDQFTNMPPEAQTSMLFQMMQGMRPMMAMMEAMMPGMRDMQVRSRV